MVSIRSQKQARSTSSVPCLYVCIPQEHPDSNATLGLTDNIHHQEHLQVHLLVSQAWRHLRFGAHLCNQHILVKCRIGGQRCSRPSVDKTTGNLTCGADMLDRRPAGAARVHHMHWTMHWHGNIRASEKPCRAKETRYGNQTGAWHSPLPSPS